jgi:hypothetical protein
MPSGGFHLISSPLGEKIWLGGYLEVECSKVEHNPLVSIAQQDATIYSFIKFSADGSTRLR